MMKLLKLVAVAVALGGALVVGGVPFVGAQAAETSSEVKAGQLPKFKRTTAELYVTAKEAGDAMMADPEIILLDVRTIPEVAFVGAPNKAYNVPFLRLITATGPEDLEGSLEMVPNEDFVAGVERVVKSLGKDKSSKIFVMCRSGGRSAAAVNVLHKQGYSQVYSVVDGFEGASDKLGRRTVNGWKNSGHDWTYKLNKDQQYRRPIR